MEAKLKFHGDVAIVSISGTLDLDKTQPLRDVCLKKFRASKIVFNLDEVNFVGSTGIQTFLSTINTLKEVNGFGVKIFGVKPELKRVIGILDDQRIQFFDSDDSALQAFKPAVAPAVIPNLE